MDAKRKISCALIALLLFTGGGILMDPFQPHSKVSAKMASHTPSSSNAWQLVWQEEFKDDEVDPLLWNVLDDALGDGDRSQHYKPANVEARDGILRIQSKKEMSAGFPYTSGALTTKGKVAFKYGLLEVKAKLPAGQGLLPAIWLWNEQGNEFPEIDIVELLGQQPGQMWNVVHYKVNERYGRDFTMTDHPDLTQDFHVYAIDWQPDKITFLLDGKPVFTSTDYVPHEEMYLFINTGVGGNWVGEPDHTTEFPAQLLVEWVRYYQK